MTETIKLMKAHTSVRRFKEQEIPQADLEEILTAGQMASSWKNFQSYSVILVRSQEKKMLFMNWFRRKPFASQLHSCFLLVT